MCFGGQVNLDLTREERLEILARNATIAGQSNEHSKLVSMLRAQINARDELWKRIQARLEVSAPLEAVNFSAVDPITYDGPITFDPPEKEATA